MKTTLKRGISWNASANGRPVFPPSAWSPMRRYRQPEPAGRTIGRRLGTGVCWALLAVLVVVGSLAGAAYLRAHEFVTAISPHTRAERVAARHLNVALPGRPTVALLLGSDFRRGGDPAAAGARSDTVMLIRVDPRRKTMSMLSLPRDLLTTIRCPGYADRIDRINAAFAECGALGTLLTVRGLTGLAINYLITVDFRGFIQLVDHLGGIWLDVDQRYFNNNTGPGGYSAINLQPGYQRLRGGDALAFVRFRHTDSDIYRNARQQLFLRALKQQVSNSLTLARLLDLVSVIEHNVTVGRAGGKGIDLRTLTNYLYLAYELPAGHLVQVRIQGLNGYNTLSASQEDIASAVEDFVHPQVHASVSAIHTTSRLRHGGIVLKPRQVSVAVLNGNGVPGAAALAAAALRKHGFRIVPAPRGQARNAPKFDYPVTTIYVDPSRLDAQPAAQLLAPLIGRPVIAPEPRAVARLANGALVTVVLGKSFGAVVGPATSRRPPSQPPNVTANPNTVLSALRLLRRRVPFPLETPRLIDGNSIADPGEPVRLYPIAPHRTAIRLTFRSGPFDYWGIQETNWLSAPVLRQPTVMEHLGRREFDLYYTGTHLHMVVLRHHGASYWIVNSLLDVLSNQTMLAIARSLVPVR